MLHPGPARATCSPQCRVPLPPTAAPPPIQAPRVVAPSSSPSSCRGVSDVDHATDLAELGRLVQTLGFDVVGTVTQRRDSLAAAAVVGEGKLKELADLTGGKGVVPPARPR